MKNVRIHKELVPIIDDLVNIFKKDIGEIKNSVQDFSPFKKFNRTNFMERAIIRSLPYYIKLAQDICRDNGKFGSLADAQKIGNKLDFYISNLYDVNKEGTGNRTEQTVICCLSIEPKTWDCIVDLAKAVATTVGIETTTSSIIKGCLMKGMEHFIQLALKNMEHKDGEVIHTLDFNENARSWNTGDLRQCLENMKVYVQDKVKELFTSESGRINEKATVARKRETANKSPVKSQVSKSERKRSDEAR